jgi:hypothetical protein
VQRNLQKAVDEAEPLNKMSLPLIPSGAHLVREAVARESRWRRRKSASQHSRGAASFLTVWFRVARRRIPRGSGGGHKLKTVHTAKIELCVARQIFDFKISAEACPLNGGPKRPDAAACCRSTTFYGEFDSGSERTVAAWIRHASRTGLSV